MFCKIKTVPQLGSQVSGVVEAVVVRRNLVALYAYMRVLRVQVQGTSTPYTVCNAIP
jgi:hypothetical protein